MFGTAPIVGARSSPSRRKRPNNWLDARRTCSCCLLHLFRGTRALGLRLDLLRDRHLRLLGTPPLARHEGHPCHRCRMRQARLEVRKEAAKSNEKEPSKTSRLAVVIAPRESTTVRQMVARILHRNHFKRTPPTCASDYSSRNG